MDGLSISGAAPLAESRNRIKVALAPIQNSLKGDNVEFPVLLAALVRGQ
jgi:hypothetical protein